MLSGLRPDSAVSGRRSRRGRRDDRTPARTPDDERAGGSLQFISRGVREERKAIIAISDGWRLLRPNRSLARLGCTHALRRPAGHRSIRAPGVRRRSPSRRRRWATSKPIPRYATRAHERWRTWTTTSSSDDSDEANRANTSFYPVDPRGLVVFDEPLSKTNDRTASTRIHDDPRALRSISRGSGPARLMLAEHRRRRDRRNNNDLAEGLKRVVDDLSSYYLLGYYSTGKLDGKFHSITVRVKRPGVQVRARRGYLAATPASTTAAAANAGPPRRCPRRPAPKPSRSRPRSRRWVATRVTCRCACSSQPAGNRETPRLPPSGSWANWAMSRRSGRRGTMASTPR